MHRRRVAAIISQRRQKKKKREGRCNDRRDPVTPRASRAGSALDSRSGSAGASTENFKDYFHL